MTLRNILVTGICGVLAALVFTTSAIAADSKVEEARAKVMPWSGYWWPHRQGRMLGPLGKYDQVTGRTAAAWERKTHPPTDDQPRWHGYCHAWAASALQEAEPSKTREAKNRQNKPVSLTVGDQKGLLAACHTKDIANIYGDRFGDGRGNEDRNDIAPDVLWRLLKLYIKQEGVPIVMDIESGPEVWNFPVYAYKIEYTGDEGDCKGKLSLWMADDFVEPDFVGLRSRKETYQFTFKRRGGSVVVGSAKWTGPSKENHPDFAWYPYVALAENPEIQYAQVQTMLGRETPSPEAPPAVAERPDRPSRPSDRPSTPPAERPTATAQTAQQDATTAVALSPMELVALIANKTSSFGFDVTVDKFDGGKYKVGDTITVSCSSEKPGYLYLLALDSKGGLTLLYPQPGESNKIEAQTRKIVPGKDAKYQFRLTEPVGVDRIKALVTTNPLILAGLDATRPEQGQAEAEQSQTQPSQQQTQQAGQSQASEPTRPEKPEPTQPSQADKPEQPAKDKPRAQAQSAGQTQGQAAPEQQAAQFSQAGRVFRLNPTQAEQVRQVVEQMQTSQTAPSQEQLGDVDPRTLIGDFAQDEVAFYVGPKADGNQDGGNAEGKPNAKPEATPNK